MFFVLSPFNFIDELCLLCSGIPHTLTGSTLEHLLQVKNFFLLQGGSEIFLLHTQTKCLSEAL